jgi:hypothetical protein
MQRAYRIILISLMLTFSPYLSFAAGSTPDSALAADEISRGNVLSPSGLKDPSFENRVQLLIDAYYYECDQENAIGLSNLDRVEYKNHAVDNYHILQRDVKPNEKRLSPQLTKKVEQVLLPIVWPGAGSFSGAIDGNANIVRLDTLHGVVVGPSSGGTRSTAMPPTERIETLF